MTYTKGPWKIRDENKQPTTVIDDNGECFSGMSFDILPEHNRRTIAEVKANSLDGPEAYHGVKNFKEAKANAYLIASAPSLFDALQSAIHCLNSVEQQPFVVSTVTECESVIRKALGEV